MIDDNIIEQCRKNNRTAQRQLYNFLASKLYYTSKRYLTKEEEIEDIVAESFITIFSKLHQLKETKALVSWAKRITINKCLYKIKQQVNFTLYLEDVNYSDLQTISEFPNHTDAEELLNLLEQLPQGCKTIFNLFVVEGYNHKEIAQQLNISVGTSKSQLNVAKKKLQQLVTQHYYSNAK